MKYIIVTPVKDEEAFIEITIQSILSQTLMPYKWIIVDDGSLDNTREVIRRYTKAHPWILLVNNNTHNQKRSGGSKVVKAFNKGYDLIRNEVFDFIVKLDGDLKLPSNYFEEVSIEFNRNKKLGLCGGVIFNKYNNTFIKESSAEYHIRGAFKSVRKECFEEIGGFREVWNWDGLDEMMAMHKGWETKVIDASVKHFRPTTAAYDIRKHSYKSGFEAYKLRSNLFLTFLRGLVKMRIKPLVFNGMHYWMGYVAAFVKQEPRIICKDLGEFINDFHLKRIFKKTNIKLYKSKK